MFKMGEGLGKFIYLLDAVNDFKEDLKKQRYNPLVAQMHMDYQMVLTAILSEVTDVLDKIHVYKDKDIIENVLYAGIWQTYIKD